MKALAISAQYPCVRVGKMTEALNEHGITHEVLAPCFPPHFRHVFTRMNIVPWMDRKVMRDRIRDSDAEILVVHNEPNWPVSIAKEAANGRPVIFSVHDVSSARPNTYEPEERAAYRDADAFIFVTEEQRQFCIEQGFDVEGKPYALVENYASASTLVDKPLLPHIGGVVYSGGLDPRGANAWRDLSPVADILGGNLHIFPGNPGITYGIVHQMVLDYPMLMQRLSQFDWGFCGTPVPNHAWGHSSPNKAWEYLAAGIPVIGLNVNRLIDVCGQGYGVYLKSLNDLPAIAQTCPKAMKRRIVKDHYRFTFAYNIGPVVDLMRGLVA